MNAKYPSEDYESYVTAMREGTWPSAVRNDDMGGGRSQAAPVPEQQEDK